ncbi:MAG: TRAP transporter small permease [Lachnospiraceae bacterium]|jgi:TRAP-type C4-dicarboxylate transport system permease small subunit|nr:TRAP transporter small permease [Lachnospiraceae bacterium]
MKRIITVLDTLIFAVAGVLTAVLLFMVLLQSLCRNLFNFSFIQIEELCILSLSWLTFLAAAYAVRHCAHVAVDFFFNKMPRPFRYGLNLVTIVVLLFLTGFMAWHGWGLAIRQMRTPLPVTHIPRGYIYLAAPVCSVFMILFFADALIDCIQTHGILGVVVDSEEQIQKELANGQQLAKDVLDKGAEGR